MPSTLLKTVPGIGEYLGHTLLYEIGDIQRFPTVKDFPALAGLPLPDSAPANQSETAIGN